MVFTSKFFHHDVFVFPVEYATDERLTSYARILNLNSKNFNFLNSQQNDIDSPNHARIS